MSKPASNVTNAEATPEQVIAAYLDLLEQNKKAQAGRDFANIVKQASKVKQLIKLISILKEEFDRRDASAELRAHPQIDKDLNVWGRAVIAKIQDVDYAAKMRLMDTIMEMSMFPPVELANALLSASYMRLHKMGAEELMHALVFKAYLAVATDDLFLRNWESRYTELLLDDEEQFTFRDIADLAYCCGEMVLELEEYFINRMCNGLEIRITNGEEISQEDAVRALHGLAMLDCIQGDSDRYKTTAESIMALITDPASLSDEDQRILLTAASWFDFETACPVPKAAPLNPENAALRDNFIVYATQNNDPPEPIKKPKTVTARLRNGERVDCTIMEEPPCHIPQETGELSKAMGFAAAVTSCIELPINMIADNKSSLRYYSYGKNWGIDDEHSLKGSFHLRSAVIAKLTGGPVLHVRDNELKRLANSNGEKLARAFGEYTWPVYDDEISGGVYHVVKKSGEILLQPA